jgi:hypothetical protein
MRFREWNSESRMRENRLSGLMRGGKPTVLSRLLPAHSTRAEHLAPAGGFELTCGPLWTAVASVSATPLSDWAAGGKVARLTQPAAPSESGVALTLPAAVHRSLIPRRPHSRFSTSSGRAFA